MQLPKSLRELLGEGLDKYLENFSRSPDGEVVGSFLVEELEVWADDEGVDDIISKLEESGQFELNFLETLDAEMSSNDEFECTGEEVLSLLERLCEIEWVEDDEFSLGFGSDTEELSEEL